VESTGELLLQCWVPTKKNSPVSWSFTQRISVVQSLQSVSEYNIRRDKIINDDVIQERGFHSPVGAFGCGAGSPLLAEYAVAEDKRHMTWTSIGRDTSDFEYGEDLVLAWELDLDAEL